MACSRSLFAILPVALLALLQLVTLISSSPAPYHHQQHQQHQQQQQQHVSDHGLDSDPDPDPLQRVLDAFHTSAGSDGYLPSPSPSPSPPKHVVASARGKHAAVASETDICTRVGIGLSERGGNAADMMVGTVLCIGVVAMYHAGIGGGGFALLHSSSGTFTALDFRETAPRAADPLMFDANPLSQVWGGASAGIPGELRGLEYIHENHGVLLWEAVVLPAVEIARKGWIVDEELLRYMNEAISRRPDDFFVEDPSWAQDFAPGGEKIKLGQRITRKRYADTLAVIAKDGVDAFYQGAIANATTRANIAAGGLFTIEDMSGYKVEVREPIQVDYHGFKVTSIPAPAGGAAVLSILKIMEGYEVDKEEDVNVTMHRLNEAMRFAFGARTVMGDPRYLRNQAEFEREVTSEKYAEEVRAKIDDKRTLGFGEYDPGKWDVPEAHGTSHIVTSDSSGLTISLTTTVNIYFGSAIMVPETGVIINDQMLDFSTPNPHPPFNRPPSPANFARPLARPLSACSPTIVTRSTSSRTSSDSSSLSPQTTTPPLLTLGAAGGPRIITLVASLLLYLLPPYMQHPNHPYSSATTSPTAPTSNNLSSDSSTSSSSSSSSYSSIKPPYSFLDALSLPRIHDSLMPNETSLEYAEERGIWIEGFSNATAMDLEERGHLVNWVRPVFSAGQVLGWGCDGEGNGGEDGGGEEEGGCGFEAVSEPRHKGSGGRVR